MLTKYSVIIPTYHNLELGLKPCCESLIKHTTLDDNIEFIIVGNGCFDRTGRYVNSLPAQFRYMDFPLALGYAKAINKGLDVAEGEFVVLLNDDTTILESPKDEWLRLLSKPFEADPNCGITGPAKAFSTHINDEFLIFFCVMLSRRLIDSTGFLDEVFKVGGGEDLDYCMRAKNAGFSIKMVPEDVKLGCDGTQLTGGFPIYHVGEQTVKKIDNWSGIFDANMKILEQKYLNKQEA